jgi:WhiB family redox-sensing transcriptional regulator
MKFEATFARIAEVGTQVRSQKLRRTKQGPDSLLSSLVALLGKPNFTPTPKSILELLELPGFFRKAKCIGQDPSIFDGETLKDILQAKKICNECPIRPACARWAIRTQDFGVWGSLTPGERRRKAKGKKVIDITELHLLETDLEKLVSNSPIEQLAVEFKVTTRTIHRWRKKVLATNKPTKKVL